MNAAIDERAGRYAGPRPGRRRMNAAIDERAAGRCRAAVRAVPA